jgi:TPR repeat protein
MNKRILIVIFSIYFFSPNVFSCDVNNNEVENFNHCMELAINGNVEAQFEVGVKYFYGIGVAKDFTQSFTWNMKAAEQGNYLAQNMLGSMFYSGKGVDKDNIQAVQWFTKAAEHGHPYAPFNLAKMYYMGEGVSQDSTQSLKWSYIAEKNGIQKAGRFRFELEQKMIFDEIKQSRELAQEWIAKYKPSDKAIN